MVVGLFVACTAAVAIGVLLRHLLWPIVTGAVRAICFVGQVIIELICDLIAAAWHLLVATLSLPVILGLLILGRWHSAYGLLQRIGMRFRRVGRRVGGLVTQSGPVAADVRHNPVPRDIVKGGSDSFPGWTLVGDLPSGGSGAQLHIAKPATGAPAESPERVVIKCFDLSAGSPLGQMIRESRALDGAKKLGLVIEHDHDENRFWYVMPYIPGTHLGEAVAAAHAHGHLTSKTLSRMLSWQRDLLATLETYHQAGLWHKDIKPENIMINDTGAHLVDLGLVTPLRSAMTLTTHGTEYFRDPELVRQALRGAKVADVDGARFDVYSAGAVLYYMMEGTFPAHGNLSRFEQSGYDAVRWVIRRAMADYHQRYESINQMLSDVDHLARASDPGLVKPADLPSFTGDITSESAVTTPEPSARVHHSNGERPRIKVTDWWTGGYRVLDPVAGAKPTLQNAFTAAERAREMRVQIRREARASRKSARRASIAGVFAFVIGCAVFVGGYFIAADILESWSKSAVGAQAEHASVTLPSGSGRVLVLNDHPSWTGGGVDLAAQLEEAGWTTSIDGVAEAGFRRALPSNGVDSHEFYDTARAALLALNLDAAAILRASGDDGSEMEVVVVTNDGLMVCHPFTSVSVSGEAQLSP